MRPKIDIFILVVIGAVFLNSLAWIFSVPFNGAPDEYDHYRLAAFVAARNRIPVLPLDQDFYFSSIATRLPITDEIVAHHQQSGMFQNIFLYELKPVYMMWPCGPHILMGMFLKLGYFFPGVPIFYFARFLSALCAVGIVLLVYDIAKKLRPDDRAFQKLSTIFVAFLPQFTFLSAYMNPDIVTVFVATLIVRLWFYALDTRWSARAAVALGAGLGCGILSKISGYSVIAASVLFLLFSLPRERRWRFLAIAGSVCLVTSGWFFVRNAVLYGDLFGYAVYTQRLKEFLAQAPAFVVERDIFSFLNQAGYRWSVGYLLYFCYSSFWGVFGWMTIQLPRLLYILAGGLLTAGVIGAGTGYARKKIAFPEHIFIFLLIAIALEIASIIAYVMMIKYQPQGRYLYPVIAPIAVIFSVGILQFARPYLRAGVIVLACSLFLIGLNIFSFLYCHAVRYFLPWA